MYKLPLQIAIFGFVILICSGQTFAYQTGTSQASPTTFEDKLVEMNYAEIQLGNLGTMNAQNPRVREFAETIVSDHTKAMSRLQGTQTSSTISTTDSQIDSTQTDIIDQTQIAGREKPDMPQTVDRSKLTREHQQTADRLNQLSGSQFDREFINTMMSEYRNEIRMLEQEAQASGDHNPEMASMAQEMLQQVRMHLTEAEQIQTELQ
jgi:putative membrane protein